MASSSECVRAEVVPSSPGAVGKGASVSRSEHSGLDQGFPRACRLTARSQFLDIYARGRRVSSRSFMIFGVPNGRGHCRLGVTATRKLGGAVLRNRAKRTLREIFRRNRLSLRPPIDLVVNASPSMIQRTPAELEAEFLRAFARLAREIRS